ncbi:MAG TPA: hypothetical protein VF664_08890, partial [Cystobacter sp.]
MPPDSLSRSASPTQSPSRRRLMRGATALGAAALLAGVALLGFGSRESEGGDETRSATVPGGPNPGPS